MGDGVPKDAKKALKFFTAAADVGQPEANCSLGLMYGMGDGVPKDPKKALKFFTAAADAGLPDANFNLGLMYGMGDGVPKDPKKAMDFFTVAADAGHPDADRMLGLMYEEDDGVRTGVKARRSVPGTLVPRQERRAELTAELASSASEVSLPKASANPFDVEARVAASLEEASGRTAPEN